MTIEHTIELMSGFEVWLKADITPSDPRDGREAFAVAELLDYRLYIHEDHLLPLPAGKDDMLGFQSDALEARIEEWLAAHADELADGHTMRWREECDDANRKGAMDAA